MNDDLQTYIEPDVEARLVALVLDEASAFEAEELERLMEERPELKACKERLEKIHGVLAEAHRDQDDKQWRLSEKRRAKVLAKVEVRQRKQLEKKRNDRVRKGLVLRRALYSLAACLVVGLITAVAYQLGDLVAEDRIVAEASGDSREQVLATRDDGTALYLQAPESGRPFSEEGEARAMAIDEQSELRFARQRLSELAKRRGVLEQEMSNENPEIREALQKKVEKTDQQIDRLASMVNERTQDTVSLSFSSEMEPGQGQLEPQVRSSASPTPEKTVSEGEIAAALADLNESLPTLADGPTLRRELDDKMDAAASEEPMVQTAPAVTSKPAPPAPAQDRFAGGVNQGGQVTNTEMTGGSGGLGGGSGGLAWDEAEKSAALKKKSKKQPEAGMLFELAEAEESEPAPDPLAVTGVFSSDLTRENERKFGLDTRGNSKGKVIGGRKADDVPSFGADGVEFAGGVEADKKDPKGNYFRWSPKDQDQTAREKVDIPNAVSNDIVSGNEGTNGIQREALSRAGGLLEVNERDGGLKKNLSAFLHDADGNAGEDFGMADAEDPNEGARTAKRMTNTRGIPNDKDSGNSDKVAKKEIPAGNNFFLGGGTVGGEAAKRNNTDFISPVDGATIPGIPDSPQENVSGIVTGGNRSGAAAVTRNSIDGILDESVAGEVSADDPFAPADAFESVNPDDEEMANSGSGADPFAAPDNFEGRVGKGSRAKGLENQGEISQPLTDAQKKQVDQVRRNLYKGEGYYDLGLYDKADEEFKKVLRTDPYNKAARRWMERTAAIKSDYYRAAYDQTRAEMLMEVDRAWDLAVPPVKGGKDPSKGSSLLPDGDSDELLPSDDGLAAETSMSLKLKQLIIPEVNFEDVTVEEAVKFFELRARELDNTTLDSDIKGVDIRLNLPETDAGSDPEFGATQPSKRKIKNLKLKNVPLETAMQYFAEAANLRYRVDQDKVTFLPPSGVETDSILQRQWEVSPELKAFLGPTGRHDPDVPIKELLMANGVAFHENSSVSYLENEGFLIVRNTPTQLELMDALVGAFKKDVEKREAAKKEAAQRRQERENFETSTAKKSDSTFSLNVSDVSFKLAKAALAEGKRPEVARVRPEEFFNALEYGDERPTQAEKVACAFEQSAHPFFSQRNLMRISMSTASLGRNAATPLRLTLLLDQSGSMERADRAESVKRAFALLAAQLTPNDEVTLVGFARTPRLLAERVKGNEAGKLAAIVANPITEGGTNLEEALSTGIQLAKQQYLEGAQNRIILLTDGAANLGDARPETLARQVESMRQADLAFDACGVGADGLNDEILSSLAKEGDGRYYFLDRPEDADEGFARQIAGALRPAASNVKVQVLFNPERVKSFYLYGFEKHRLKKEDFRNDAVDAAEMAAEESGVALYHFEALPDGRGDVGTVSVRFLDTASQQMVERTWAIPYEPEAAFFNEAERKLRLAGVAGLFAEKLAESPVGERVELKRLRQELEVLKPSFGDQTRFQELQTMLRQAGE